MNKLDKGNVCNNNVTQIPIIFSTNNKYAKYTSVAIQSVLENKSPLDSFLFYILHNNIDKSIINKLKSQIRNFNNSKIEFMNMSSYFSKYKLNERKHISSETFYRLYIPTLFSKYEKVLYLDGDVICRTNIKELFQINLGDKCIGAVKDAIGIGLANSPFGEKRKEEFNQLNMKDYTNYFNAGVLILNIKQINSEYNNFNFVKNAEHKQYPWQDQDLLNVIFENKVKYLDYCWNMSPHKNHIIEVKYAPLSISNEWNKNVLNPKIVHFAGSYEYKPWIDNKIEYSKEFWDYSTRTPFYNEIKNIYEKTKYKMFFVRLFNKLFKKGTKRRMIIKRIKNHLVKKDGE